MTTYGITGATGQIGGQVARALAARGVAQRLIVRDPTRAPDLPRAEVAYASRGYFGADAWQLDAWVSTYQAIAAGDLAQVSDDVQRLTGDPARRLEEVWSGR